MYANAERKETIVTLAGCVGFADTLLRLSPMFPEGAKENLIKMMDGATAALDAYTKGLDRDQISGILRWANNSELKAIPKTAAQRAERFYVLTDDEMSLLCDQVSGECMVCEKNEHQVKKCRIRKILLLGGAKESNPECVCPFVK